MKKLIGLLAALVFSLSAAAQMTTVSATVTDSDGTLWANGTVAVQFVPNPAQPNQGMYKLCSSGAPLTPTILNQPPVNLGGAGQFSVTTYDNSQVCPNGSQWQFTVCPNASSKCGSVVVPTTGASQSITTQVTTTIPAPRFQATVGNFGYTDGEAILQLTPGGLYYNVTDLCYRQFSGSSFSCLGAGNPFNIPIPVNQGGTGSTIGGLNGTGSILEQIPGSFSPTTQPPCTAEFDINGGSILAQTGFPGLPVVLALCAAIIMPSNDPTVITGGSSTSSTITVNVASLPSAFKLVGLPIMVSGVTPSGFNTPLQTTPPATLATVVSFTNTSLTYTSTNNPGAWVSGGTLALATSIQSDGIFAAIDNFTQGNPSTGGSAALGVGSQVIGHVPDSSQFASNFVAQIAANAPGSTATAMELDVDTLSSGSNLFGLSIDAANWAFQPTNSFAVNVAPPGGTANAQWGAVFLSQSTASKIGLELGFSNAPLTTGPSPSQEILLINRFSNGTNGLSNIASDALGDLLLTPAVGQSSTAIVESTTAFAAPSANFAGIASAAIIKSLDGTTAQLLMDSTGGNNFLLSEDNTGGISENLNISGPNAAAIPTVDINATQTLLNGGLIVGAASGCGEQVCVAGAVGAAGLALSGTPSFTTGTAANTDVTGELSFVSAATASFTFAHTYSVHPECTVTPQFNSATDNYWVTYTGSTGFTINFASTTTGVVSYTCVGRD